jgi:hypothetical protein
MSYPKFQRIRSSASSSDPPWYVQGTLAISYRVASVVARLRSEPVRSDPNSAQPPHAAAERKRSVADISRPGFRGCTQARILSACPAGHARSPKQGARGGKGRGST